MKLPPRAFHILWDVHAWGGALCSLVLFVMFFAGGFALFRHELDAWSAPACERDAAALPPLAVMRAQLTGAERVAFAPEATGLRVYLTRAGRDTVLCWSTAERRLEPVADGVGGLLYGLHFLEPLPGGLYVAGVAGLVLFLAAVTGFAILLKDRVRHWFRFRARGAPRVVASDAHKLLGIVGLPYQLLYAWTGAMLCLGAAVLQPVFARGGAHDGAPIVEPPPTAPLDTRDLDTLVGSAIRHIPDFAPSWIALADDTVDIYGEVATVAFGYGHLAIRAHDGVLTQLQRPQNATAYERFEAWFYGLHFARFGGLAIRVLFAVLALATCLVIVTGNLVWLERRDRQRAIRGHRVLAQLTVGICGGVIGATLVVLATRNPTWFWLTWLGLAIAPLAFGYDLSFARDRQSRQRPRSS